MTTFVQTSFKKLAKNMHRLDQKGLIRKEILQEGNENDVEYGYTVLVHCEINFESQPPVFSTLRNGQPETLLLMKGKLLEGLLLAVLSMKPAEVSRFLINHQLAYGEKGTPPLIPAKATACFEITLLEIIDVIPPHEFALPYVSTTTGIEIAKNLADEALKSFENFDELKCQIMLCAGISLLRIISARESRVEVGDKEKAEESEIGKKIEEHPTEGTIMSSANQAIKKEETHSDPPTETPQNSGEPKESSGKAQETSNGTQKKLRETLIWLKINLAGLFQQRNRNKEACLVVAKIFQLDPSNWRAFYLLSRSLISLGDLKEAGRVLAKGLKIYPQDSLLVEQWRRLVKKQEDMMVVREKT